MTRHLITVVRGLREGEGETMTLFLLKLTWMERCWALLSEDKKVYIWFNIKGITWQSSNAHSKSRIAGWEVKSGTLNCVNSRTSLYKYLVLVFILLLEEWRLIINRNKWIKLSVLPLLSSIRLIDTQPYYN